MALQGRALHKVCRGVWRKGFSGVSNTRVLPLAQGIQQPQISSLSRDDSRSARLSTPRLHPALQTSCLEVKTNSEKNIDDLLSVGAKFGNLSLCVGEAEQSSPVTTGENLNLASWQSSDYLEYICPSDILSSLPQLVIIEETPHAVSYDLPQIPTLSDLIIDPTNPTAQSDISEPVSSHTNAPKQARAIQRIRRKKMKRHQLKKFRKRMKFTLRKIRRNQREKKRVIFEARLAAVKAWGDDFSAKDWLEEELDRARKGGFYINVLAKKQ